MEKHIQYTNTFKLNHMVKYSKLKSWIPECFYLSFHEVTDTLESNSKKKLNVPLAPQLYSTCCTLDTYNN